LVLTPAPTPSASRARPVDQKAAVVAAVRAFYAAVDLGLRTGQTANIVKTSTPDCPCRNVVKTIHSMFSTGRVVGSRVVISHVQLEIFEPTVAVIYLVNDYPAFTIVNPEGHTVESGARYLRQSAVRVRLWPQGWLVEAVGVIPK
jgi:hypothetical protein